jgi:hypothetical protein
MPVPVSPAGRGSRGMSHTVVRWRSAAPDVLLWAVGGEGRNPVYPSFVLG